jgi:hypothetical protein
MLVAVEDYMVLVEMVDKVLIAGLMLVAQMVVVAATELPH